MHDTDRKDERNFVTTIGTEMAPAKEGTATKAKPSEYQGIITNNRNFSDASSGGRQQRQGRQPQFKKICEKYEKTCEVR
jgi:hypothetical protein